MTDKEIKTTEATAAERYAQLCEKQAATWKARAERARGWAEWRLRKLVKVMAVGAV